MKSSSKGRRQNRKSKEEILNYSLLLLSKKDYSEFELKRKLLKKFGKSSIEEVIKELEGKGLLSDERYAEKLIEKYAFSKMYGYFKVESELLDRGLKKSSFMDILNRNYTVEKEKENIMKLLDKKSKEKIYPYLINRGFRPHIVQEVLASRET